MLRTRRFRWVTTKRPSRYRLRLECRDRNRGPNRCFGYYAEVLAASAAQARRRMRVNLALARRGFAQEVTP